MSERRSVQLVGDDGTIVALPLVPETLTRHRTGDDKTERLAFTAHLDDRHGDGSPATAAVLDALAGLEAIVELEWGERSFRVELAEITITETAFDKDLHPLAATIEFGLDVWRHRQDD